MWLQLYSLECENNYLNFNLKKQLKYSNFKLLFFFIFTRAKDDGSYIRTVIKERYKMTVMIQNRH